MHNFGHTRSANRRDHLLLTADTFIRTPLPGLTRGIAIVHVAPTAGAAFTQMTVEIEPGGALTQGPAQRLLYVIEGRLTLSVEGNRKLHKLAPGGYAYIPTKHAHTLSALTAARVAVIDKPYLPLDSAPNPGFLVGREQDLPAMPLNGDKDLLVRSLLPADLAFDFACNTMTYAPGAALSQVEIHYMEHGLLMLDGGGIYRLGDNWYPTTAGDFIWMAPYCPQWFGALGKTPTRYLIYKDFNRHTL